MREKALKYVKVSGRIRSHRSRLSLRTTNRALKYRSKSLTQDTPPDKTKQIVSISVQACLITTYQLK